MQDQYYPPQYQSGSFHCPHCHVYAMQIWWKVSLIRSSSQINTDYHFSRCSHCSELSVWSLDGKLLLPQESPIVMPSPDLPEDCKVDYMEARSVYPDSPKASAALLRLCIQKLMVHLGEEGKNLNDDIAALVRKGLSPLTQKALDVCRVVGNNAVHPGKISIEDTPTVALSLFELINFIADDRITKPKQIENLYASLPHGAREAIEKRDGSAN